MLKIESCFVVAAIALAFANPNLGSRGFLRLERAFRWLARRPRLSVLIVGLVALLARLAVLPVEPIPEPTIHDEFSQLLLGDTFAYGRLANPIHPMWVHFETFHILWHPTYASIFYPAQGLFLAAGQLIAHHPFWGVWFSAGLMCAAICWALQGWLPGRWALLGGALAIMRIDIFSYWANSYYGGAVAAIGGALVLGALPRIHRHQRARDGLLLGLGLAILAGSRPYEGIFLALPIGLAILTWMVEKKGSLSRVPMQRAVTLALLVAALASCALAYYFWRVTGSPFHLPYQVSAQTYGVAYFPWQKPAFPPHYNHAVLQEGYRVQFYGMYEDARRHPFLLALWNVVPLWLFFIGPALTIPLVMLLIMAPARFSFRRVGSKTRILVLVCFSVYVGMALLVYRPAPHYAAPAVVALYALVLQAMRHLRLWRWHGRPAGRFMVRAVPSICFIMLLLRAAVPLPGIPVPTQNPLTWCSSHRGNLDRARILAQLKSTPGYHLVMVRCTPKHNWTNEWVYNEAEIDQAKVVWARDMSPAENQELFTYFKDRQVWVIDPDNTPVRLLPYEPVPTGR
jgi:hypothetical protein